MISTKGRYALRVMIDIGMHSNGEYISLKDVSSRQNVSIKYLEQVISLLNKGGYVRSLRGNNGGYRLAVDPDKCTAGDILRTIEGPLSPVSCLRDKPNLCEKYNECTTVSFWQGLYDAINTYVDSVTLRQLIDSANKHGADNYCI